MDSEELKQRTTQFAHRCVKLCLSLPNNALGRNLRNQLIRSSTSVAANYRSACIAQTKASFIAKLSIALEESDESQFWLEFIIAENLQKRNLVEPLLQEATDLTAILVASRKTARKSDNYT